MSSPDTSRPRGLRTVVYHVPDLARAREWYARLFQRLPYFDEPFYVGFDVGGYELGLHPADDAHPVGAGGVVAYWGVEDLAATLADAQAHGATLHHAVQDVGEGIRVASVLDPFGNVVGLIENPHFALTDAAT